MYPAAVGGGEHSLAEAGGVGEVVGEVPTCTVGTGAAEGGIARVHGLYEEDRGL